MEIKQSILPKSNKKLRPGYSMAPKYITVHNTANASKGANAEMHARYLQNGAGGRQASWHFTVDDKQIYQHLPTNESGWHSGDGAKGTGNRQSIGIEICENSDGDFAKAVKNAQNLIRDLMTKHNIPLKNVVPHKHWSGKNCPRLLLKKWDDFVGGITSSSKPSISKPQTGSSSSATAPSSGGKLTVDGSWGPATTRALQDRFGTTVDGVISGQPNNVSVRNIPSAKIGTTGSNLIRAMQRHYKSGIVDGKISGTSNLITKMQRKFGLSIVDGKVSNPSNLVKEIQRRLNAGTL